MNQTEQIKINNQIIAIIIYNELVKTASNSSHPVISHSS